MKMAQIPRPAMLGVLLAAAFAETGSAWAQDSQSPLTYYAGISLRRESNLFRLPEGSSPQINGVDQQRNDSVIGVYGGLRFDRRYSLQRFLVDLRTDFWNYQHFSQLNSNTTNANFLWQWASGLRWRGDINAFQYQNVVNFADVRGPAATSRNVGTTRSITGDANFQYAPDLYVGGGVGYTSVSFNTVTFATAENTAKYLEAKWSYRPPTLNLFGVTLRRTTGVFPGIDSSQVDRDFTQWDLLVPFTWKLNPAVEYEGYLGYTNRRYPNVDVKNYSGLVGRLTLNWRPTDRLLLPFTARREIGARVDAVSNFILTDGIAFVPQYLLTEKVTLNGRLETYSRDFVGDPFGQQAGGQVLNDRVNIYGLGAKYDFTRNVYFFTSYAREQRSSSNPILPFANNVVTIGVQGGI